MTDKTRWVTTQFRARGETHDWLKAQAAEAGVSVTVAAGALLDWCCKQGMTLGPLVITKQPGTVAEKV
jgi:hypothetical protein